MKLIDKDALLAELERRIKTNKECMLGLRNLDYYQGKVDALNDTISSLDTLEVKEVDIEEEVESLIKSVIWRFADKEDFLRVAKHFSELGLRASNPLTWEDIRKIDTLCCKVEMEHIPKEEEHYQEVLKRFKEQKGE